MQWGHNVQKEKKNSPTKPQSGAGLVWRMTVFLAAQLVSQHQKPHAHRCVVISDERVKVKVNSADSSQAFE